MSKRIYITLNEKKAKDKIILEFLSSTYNESDAIKNILYQFALSGDNEMQMGAKLNKEIEINNNTKDAISAETVIKDDKVKTDIVKVDEDIMSLFK